MAQIVKNPPASAGDTGSIPGSGRSPGRQSTPVFLPGESHGQRSLAGYRPQGHKSQTRLSDLTTRAEWIHTPGQSSPAQGAQALPGHSLDRKLLLCQARPLDAGQNGLPSPGMQNPCSINRYSLKKGTPTGRAWALSLHPPWPAHGGLREGDLPQGQVAILGVLTWEGVDHPGL